MRRKSHVQAMTVNSSAQNDTATEHNGIHVVCVGNAFSRCVIITIDCARSNSAHLRHGVQPQTKVIRIQISGEIRISIRMSAGSLPKCCGFVTLAAPVISPSVVKIGR